MSSPKFPLEKGHPSFRWGRQQRGREGEMEEEVRMEVEDEGMPERQS